MRERMHRFAKYMQFKGLNDNQVTIDCGLGQGLLSQARKGKSDLGVKTVDSILRQYQDLNKVWLLTGEGEMLIGEGGADALIGKNSYRLVPVIHIDSVGGIHSDNDIISPEYVDRYIPIEGARDGDVVIFQSGTSMAPAIPSGAALLIREVQGWREYIGYGDVFVLLLEDGRRITKEIRRYDDSPKDYYWCVSYNPDVADEELPKGMVCRVWKVIKIMIDKGW